MTTTSWTLPVAPGNRSDTNPVPDGAGLLTRLDRANHPPPVRSPTAAGLTDSTMPVTGPSSSAIVPVAAASASAAPPVGALSVTVKVSSASSVVSSSTGTLTVFSVSPGRKVSVPPAAA